MTHPEKYHNSEVSNAVSRYESRLDRRMQVNTEIHAAWDVANLRWDATAPHMMPPEVIFATGEMAGDSIAYEDTLIGRVSQLGGRVAEHFAGKGILPDRSMLLDSFVDASVAAILRIKRTVPEEYHPVVEQSFATIGEIGIQGIILQVGRQRVTHASSNQFNDLLFSELDYAENTAPLVIRSTDEGFMSKDTKNLSDYFHGKVEQLLGPDNNTGFMFVRSAVLFAEGRHGDQKRFDGTMNRDHILRHGIRLLEDEHFMKDPQPLEIKLAAAHLHDVVEDTTTELSEIEQHFGPDVKNAVDILSRFVMTTGEERSDIEYYGRLLHAPGYVMDIKGQDRVDNLEALLHLDLQSQDRREIVHKGRDYLKETRQYYPLLVVDNPNLQERLAYLADVVEQHYPVYDDRLS